MWAGEASTPPWPLNQLLPPGHVLTSTISSDMECKINKPFPLHAVLVKVFHHSIDYPKTLLLQNKPSFTQIHSLSAIS